MDDLVKRVAQAICLRERGYTVGDGDQCRACHNAQYDGEEYLDLGDGCLGFGCEYLADVAIDAYKTAAEEGHDEN